MKRQIELIENCTNEHDKKLMIKLLDESNKRMNKAYLAIGLSIVSFIVAFFGFHLELIRMVIPFLIIGFCSIIYAIITPLRGVGLI